MSDPAIEAAKRAIDQIPMRSPSDSDLIVAARQALKPLRDKCRDLFDEATLEMGGADNPFPAGMMHVLRELAPLIYTDDDGPEV